MGVARRPPAPPFMGGGAGRARGGRESLPNSALGWAPAWRSPTPPPGWFQLLLLVSHSFLFWQFDFQTGHLTFLF